VAKGKVLNDLGKVNLFKIVTFQAGFRNFLKALAVHIEGIGHPPVCKSYHL
jgi:hypothetical protein